MFVAAWYLLFSLVELDGSQLMELLTCIVLFPTFVQSRSPYVLADMGCVCQFFLNPWSLALPLHVKGSAEWLGWLDRVATFPLYVHIFDFLIKRLLDYPLLDFVSGWQAIIWWSLVGKLLVGSTYNFSLSRCGLLESDKAFLGSWQLLVGMSLWLCFMGLVLSDFGLTTLNVVVLCVGWILILICVLLFFTCMTPIEFAVLTFCMWGNYIDQACNSHGLGIFKWGPWFRNGAWWLNEHIEDKSHPKKNLP